MSPNQQKASGSSLQGRCGLGSGIHQEKQEWYQSHKGAFNVMNICFEMFLIRVPFVENGHVKNNGSKSRYTLVGVQLELLEVIQRNAISQMTKNVLHLN